jgi:MFS family permease
MDCFTSLATMKWVNLMASDSSPARQDGTGAWLMLAMLFLAYIFAIVDRFILALLAEPIRADLGISDTDIALLYGLTFLLMNSVLQLPLGRLVDRYPRIPLAAAGIALWSVMTVASGLATRFSHLAFARLFVGAGEAALIPAAYSLIGDSFTRRRLGIAMGIFYLGGNLSVGVSLIVGSIIMGWASRAGPLAIPHIGLLQPWQVTFIVVGLPGLILAALMMFMPEPARIRDKATAPSWGDIMAYLRVNAGWLVPVHLGSGCAVLILTSALSWIVILLGRRHGWSIEQAGLICGLTACAASLIGFTAGGVMSDRLQRSGSHRRLTLCAMLMGIAILAGTSFPLMANPFFTVMLCGALLMATGPVVASASAGLQDMAPPDMRGILGGLFTMVINLIGGALGPLLVATISDRYFPGGAGIANAMAIVQGMAAAIGLALFMLAAKRLKAAAA